MIGNEIDKLLLQMSRKEVLALIERLAENLREREEGESPRSLEGTLRGIADPDFDIDAALRDIRMSWQRELTELS